ncbi:hypothetical protein SteCoe_32172 [Stentor coeruleus]|uniref:ADP/ATP translocase n=1 Tax=Stentor coeruleus TaxID=5963 RepID=A0A1R2AZK9_9CILI|nr:hypothetical protein SteCoe_32172 [Stentor coeruleus]
MAHSGSPEFDFALKILFGGVIAGIAKTIPAPIERVQLLLQLQDAKKCMEDPSKKYKGIINCFSRVYKEQGLMSFWRGNLPNVIKFFPTQLCILAIKDNIEKLLPKYNPKTHFLNSFIMNSMSGGLAGCISLCVSYPFDFIRTRMATDIGKNKSDREFLSMADVVNKTMKTDGISGIYRGASISMIGIFLYRFLYFGMIDTGKMTLFDDTTKSKFFLFWSFAQTITIFLRFITYPLDTIRRKMMMQSGRNNMLYDNTIDCIAKIYMKEGGIKGFFKGAGCNVVKGTGGTMIMVYITNSKSSLDTSHQ